MERLKAFIFWRATLGRCRWWGGLEMRVEMTEHFPPVLLGNYLALSLP